MQNFDLKAAVTQAVNQSWPDFEQAHPALACILDRCLLVEEAQKQLEHDPAYQQALAQARQCGTADDLLRAVQPMVAALFARLMGC